MARLLCFLVLFCAVAFVANADGDDLSKQSWGRPVPYPRPLPLPYPRNPCVNCAKCVSKDHYRSGFATHCARCEKGYKKEHGFCVRDDPCVCTKEYKPVCGKDGVKYGNACMARCAGTIPKCDGGCPCKKPPQPCPLCRGNPCDWQTCPSHPQAKCRVKHCSCKPEWVWGDRIVDCKPIKPPVIPPPTCPPGVPYVACFADPCKVTKCKAFPHAKCKANFCGGCNAEFFVNGHKVDCDKCQKMDQPCRDDSDCCGLQKCCRGCQTTPRPGPWLTTQPKGVCKEWCPSCHHPW